MSDKKINLEEILENKAKEFGNSNFTACFVNQHCVEDVVYEAMKEACRQILEVAAENIKERKFAGGNSEFFIDSKQSILSIINQIE